MDLAQYEKLDPQVALKAADGGRVVFKTPNRLCLARVRTLYSKEPHTIAWLNGLTRESVLLDVGANIGLYSLYAATARGCRVFAFEPESQNYAQLNRNIQANRLGERITAYPCALSDRVGLDLLYLSRFETGGSCHSFGEEVDFNLLARPASHAQGCASWTIDAAVAGGALPPPRYIKIDVDGFEHKVIAGALQTLSGPDVAELLIEVNPKLAEHRAMVEELAALGFHFDSDQAAATSRPDGIFAGVGEWLFKRR
jgi:FkbM family methyltransferase